MALQQGHGQLGQHFPSLIFFEINVFHLRLFVLGLLRQQLFAFANSLREVSACAILHHDVETGMLFVNDSVVVASNVRMLKLLKNVYFAHQHLLLFFTHLPII